MIGIALTLALCPWLADAAWAQRRSGNPTINSRVTRQVAGLVLPDLRCTIIASENQNGTKPIQNGVDIFPGPSVWIRVEVQNTGGADAVSFNTSLSVQKDGIQWLTENEGPQSLTGGFKTVYGPYQMQIAQKSNDYTAQAKVDINNGVSEGSEANNLCDLGFTATAPI
jgi:hypothetical protein